MRGTRLGRPTTTIARPPGERSRNRGSIRPHTSPVDRRAAAKRGLAALLPALVAGACASFGGARPRFAPLPEAVVRETPGPAAEHVTALAGLMRDSGLAVAVEAPREGYLESRWYDLDRRRTVGAPFRRLDRIVKLRIYADPVRGHSRVVGECVMRIAWDPSRPERELEVMVPAGHEGRGLLDLLLRTLPAIDSGAARR